ncbi:hypothetical protein LXA43DRAFT_880093 [Ganoderma leucocontextum]|nr:hypothetical protein LXA43DRAFT_880093 [Ganoderma leucocontextum]
MASAASPPTPSGGVGSSIWANQPPSRQGWGRSGEPGTAFRGMTRGRPGRGKDTAPPLASAVSSTSASNKAPSPALSKASVSSKDTKSRPRKASEARAPRKVVPPIVIEPAPIAGSDSSVSATAPNRSRRKYPQNRSTSSISSSKKSPSSESSTSLLRAERSPVISKDLPPHLVPPPPPETPTFDIKHDIDALVERVRAVAMDRPNTPGSHIDWAGEDDDSLPDLDDWGVKSVTDKGTSSCIPERSGKPDLLSPMLADALKPLPSIDVGSPLAVPTAPPPEISSTVVEAPAKGGLGDNTPRGPPASSKANSKDKSASEKPPPAAPKKQGERKGSDGKPPVPSTKPAAEQVEAPKPSPSKQANVPLHPSLPAKPVGAIDALAKRAPRKPPVPVQTPDPAVDVDAPLKSGLSESTHALKASGLVVHEPSSASPSPERQGVSASIHAPVQSAPSNITSHSTPNFLPGHGRAHTMGRPRDLRVPVSAPHASFLDRPSDASRRDINHARTHSSPPTGPGTSTARSRTVHATRPVITVAALSGIARVLGGSPPKREAGSVAAGSKD